jgi:hypothetical protein
MHFDRQPNDALRQFPMAQPRRISVAHRGPRFASVIKMQNESTNSAIRLVPNAKETTFFATPERSQHRNATSALAGTKASMAATAAIQHTATSLHPIDLDHPGSLRDWQYETDWGYTVE